MYPSNSFSVNANGLKPTGGPTINRIDLRPLERSLGLLEGLVRPKMPRTHPQNVGYNR